MPTTSRAQHNLMAMVAHDPKAAKRLGIPQSVGKEFTEADKGRKFGSGGRPDLAKVNKPKADHGKMNLFRGGGMAKDKLKSMFKGKETYAEELKEAKAIKSGKITPQEYAKGEKMEGHCGGGKIKKMAAGGRTSAKGMHPVQTKSKRGAIQVAMKKGGKC